MKHNKMFILFPFVFSMVAAVLILFSCYPGTGPGTDPVPRPVVDFPAGYVTGGLKVTNDSTLVVPMGKTYTALAIEDDKGVSVSRSDLNYLSEDPTIASVDNSGNITGKKLGYTSIFITTESGDASTTITATVKDLQVYASSDRINSSTTVTMGAVLLPGSETISNLKWGIGTKETPTDGNSSITDDGKLTTTLTSGSVDVIASTTYGLLEKPKVITVEAVDSAAPIISLGNEDGDKPNKIMKDGDTVQLNATVDGVSANTLVTWTSSDTSVATVNNGLVTVIGEGNATITASYQGSSATFMVNARSLEIDAPEEKIITKDGTTINLKAVIHGDPSGDMIAENIVWTLPTPNGLVATIDSVKGIISINGSDPGNYSITVSAALSENEDITATETIAIQIYEDIFIWGEDENDDKTSIIMPVGATYDMLKVIDKDGDPVSTDTLTFTSSMPAVATVRSNGLVDGVSTGNTTITVTSIYGNAKAYVIVNVRDLKVVSSSNTITAGMPIPLQMRAVLIPGEEPLDSLITWTAMDAEDDSTDGITITSDSSHGAYGYLTTTRTEAGKVDVIASSTYRLEAKKDPPVDIVGTETPVVVIEAGTGWNPLAAVGDTFTLTAERSGTSDPVMWSSNNTSVATVSDGVIDVVGVGDAIITASAGTAKAEFEVNARGLVIGPEDAELKLSLLGTLLSGLLGSDPLQLYVTMTGGTSDIPVSTVVWEIANIDALTLLSTPKIDKHSGVLSMEAGLLNITGLLAIGSVDVKASLPGTNITATKSIDIVSLL